MNHRLVVRDVSYQYDGHSVLNGINFSADGGEFIVLMGLNGAGKSTLLDIVAGLRKPGGGEVLLNNRRVSSYSAKDRSRLVSHLPQGTRTDLPFTVQQVVLMGRYPYADRWFESDEDHAYAQDAMLRMDCHKFCSRLYATLSGGEQQRVLLAACIAQCPSLMLFDEPSTFLDVHQQLQCFATLSDLAREGALCIAVTHDLNLALAYCSRLLILSQGALVEDFAADQAAANPTWLSLLSTRLHMAQTAEGKPWVHYR